MSALKHLDPEVLSRLARMPLLARGPMLGSVTGRHQSPHRGSSVEFAEYRKYVPGDDTRRVDWRVFARSDRYYIKEFDAETNLRCYLVVDTSASMAYGEPNKLQIARQLANTLAYLAISQGDAVGLCTIGETVQAKVAPSRRPAQVKIIHDLLDAAQPSGGTGLVDGLHAVAEEIPPRAVVAVLSDFFAEVDELQHCLEHFRFRHHDLVLFHLLDPREIDFDFDQPRRFVDMEGEDAILTDPSLIAEHYQEALQRYLERLQRGAERCHADYHRVDTSRPYEEAMAHFLTNRLALLAAGR